MFHMYIEVQDEAGYTSDLTENEWNTDVFLLGKKREYQPMYDSDYDNKEYETDQDDIDMCDYEEEEDDDYSDNELPDLVSDSDYDSDDSTSSMGSNLPDLRSISRGSCDSHDCHQYLQNYEEQRGKDEFKHVENYLPEKDSINCCPTTDTYRFQPNLQA